MALALPVTACADASTQLEKSRDNPLAAMWAGVID